MWSVCVCVCECMSYIVKKMNRSMSWHVILICLFELTINCGGLGTSKSEYYNGSKRSACLANINGDNEPLNRFNSSMVLRKLRTVMSRRIELKDDPLDGYIITTYDEHQSEFISPHDMRLKFLSGFSGSRGIAVVTSNKAVLWTDGRYHLQADQELDCNWILMKEGYYGVPSITEWLKTENTNHSNIRIGADDKLIPTTIWQRWNQQLSFSNINLVAVYKNLIDLIWRKEEGRPEANAAMAYPLNNTFAGKSWQKKVHEIREQMSDKSTPRDALVITALDEIAWVLNIRGWDLPNTPVLKSYVIITQGWIYLYTDRRKVVSSLNDHLKLDGCSHADCVKLKNYTDIWDDLGTMSQNWSQVWLPIRCNEAEGVSHKILTSIPYEKQVLEPSPIIEMRAIKNNIEIKGMRNAHIRDAAAMCDFFSYMEKQLEHKNSEWTEMNVANTVNEFRSEMQYNQGNSFETTVAYGAHAALPHYVPTKITSVDIGFNSTLLIDSGGQYYDGTTDVTRTLHFGEPTREQIEAYTRVLIGSIQLASLIFPSRLTGSQIDTMARESMWAVGDDYSHGTGHGIGHFLSVHEPPISISYTNNMNGPEIGCTNTLLPGFFLSNEPGYYKTDDFGIRLENILEVVRVNESKYNKQSFLKFRDATLIPYEPKLIDINMLTPAHRRWLNNYNQRIRDEVGPELIKLLKMQGYKWMMKKTRSIPEKDDVDTQDFVSQSNSVPYKYSHFSVVFSLILFSIYITRYAGLS